MDASKKSADRAGISVRAMLVGAVLCGAIAVGLPYGEFVLNGTQLGLNSSTPAAFFLLFLLVALVQPLLGLVRRDWLFSRAELLSIAVMMMITTAIAARGFISIAVPILTGIFYFASPGKQLGGVAPPARPHLAHSLRCAGHSRFLRGPAGRCSDPLGRLAGAAFVVAFVYGCVLRGRRVFDGHLAAAVDGPRAAALSADAGAAGHGRGRGDAPRASNPF